VKCPHCTIAIHESWTPTSVTNHRGDDTGWRVDFMICPQCTKQILRIGRLVVINNTVKVADWIQAYPSGSTRGPVAPQVPKDIASDYNEAAKVLEISPKASAALSRRCLQSVLWGAGYSQKDLSKQIDAVLAETNTTKALPSGVHSIVDAIRNFGNFSAHRITDTTSLQIIDVQPHEAEFCLEILDAMFDHYYVKPAQAKAIKDALNAKLAAAKKPAAK
jgi:Domain of unknown function (DUF4145)